MVANNTENHYASDNHDPKENDYNDSEADDDDSEDNDNYPKALFDETSYQKANNNKSARFALLNGNQYLA